MKLLPTVSAARATYIDASSSAAEDVAPMVRLIEDPWIPAVGEKITAWRKRPTKDDAMAFSNGNR
jgi:hypothetical protein